MTTIFGLRHPKVDLGILVADRQSTSLGGGIPNGKYLQRKLWKSEDGYYCFGHAGLRDERTEEFAHRLSEGKFDVKKIVSNGYFPELRKLNVQRLGRKFPDLQQLSSMVMLTRFNNNPKLYLCYPLGEVEEGVWFPIGSGDKKVDEYMQAMQVMSEARNYLTGNSEIESGDIIRVGLEAVRRSQSQDLYSHGLDMMICTPEDITDHFEDLGDDFEQKLKKIQKKYNSSKQ